MRARALARFPELRDFVSDVERSYGARLRGIHLFGSRAGGKARPDSDYDVAIVLDDLDDFWTEKMRLADLAYDQVLARDLHIQAHPFSIEEWEGHDRGDLVLSAQRVAMELSP